MIPVVQLFDNSSSIDETLLYSLAEKYNVRIDSPIKVIPFGDSTKTGSETRYYYFDLAVGDDNLLRKDASVRRPQSHQNDRDLMRVTRLLSYGDCNVACPYCKRDCQFVDEHGTPIISQNETLSELIQLAQDACDQGEILRFSGGDPVMFGKETLLIAEYVYLKYGKKVSIAHNGSSPKWAQKMAPYLDSAAIDVKGHPSKVGTIMGTSKETGERLFERSVQTIELLSNYPMIVDARTPLFGSTTLDELRYIADQILPINNERIFWTTRLYKEVHGCDFTVPDEQRMIDLLLTISQSYPESWIGIRAKWHDSSMLYIKNGNIVNLDSSFETNEKVGSGNSK